MCDMKKDYVKPSIKAVNVEGCENLLQSSYVDIGGNTDRFNVRRRRYSHEIYDEFDDEDDED